MCQIQLIKKVGRTGDDPNLNHEDMNEFIKLMNLGRHGNGDAFGILANDFMIKMGGKFSISRLDINKIGDIKSSFVLGHNRFSTNYRMVKKNIPYPITNIPYGTPFFFNSFSSFFQKIDPAYFNGDCECYSDVGEEDSNENHHPFRIGELSLMHNGIIHNDGSLRKRFGIESDISTDSYVILALISNFMESRLKSSNNSRIDSIVYAIQETTRIINGSYSVMLYDHISDHIYYFKNYSTSFAFKIVNQGENKIIIGSTEMENLDTAYMFSKDYTSIIPKEGIIYLIGNSFTEPIIKLSTFKEQGFLSSWFEDESPSSSKKSLKINEKVYKEKPIKIIIKTVIESIV